MSMQLRIADPSFREPAHYIESIPNKVRLRKTSAETAAFGYLRGRFVLKQRADLESLWLSRDMRRY
jgi:hypothetical protein